MNDKNYNDCEINVKKKDLAKNIVKELNRCFPGFYFYEGRHKLKVENKEIDLEKTFEENDIKKGAEITVEENEEMIVLFFTKNNINKKYACFQNNEINEEIIKEKARELYSIDDKDKDNYEFIRNNRESFFHKDFINIIEKNEIEEVHNVNIHINLFGFETEVRSHNSEDYFSSVTSHIEEKTDYDINKLKILYNKDIIENYNGKMKGIFKDDENPEIKVYFKLESDDHLSDYTFRFKIFRKSNDKHLPDTFEIDCPKLEDVYKLVKDKCKKKKPRHDVKYKDKNLYKIHFVAKDKETEEQRLFELDPSTSNQELDESFKFDNSVTYNVIIEEEFHPHEKEIVQIFKKELIEDKGYENLEKIKEIQDKVEDKFKNFGRGITILLN